jgi:hypothetical protein
MKFNFKLVRSALENKDIKREVRVTKTEPKIILDCPSEESGASHYEIS